MKVAKTMKTKLEEALFPQKLKIRDDSEKHKGHAGWREEGETHFHVELVSNAFEGLNRVQRQREVYRVLKEEMAGPVHALTLDLKTPGEAG